MGHIFLSFIFYNFILSLFYSHYRKGHYYIDKTHLIIYTLLLIAFGTFGTGEGDYIHYKEDVERFHSLFDVLYHSSMEIQYNYLAYFVGGNYTLWRLVIFSVQFIGMSWLLYKAKLNTYPVYLSFITICLVYYTYQRSYWGVIFYFLGFYLLLEKKNPLFLIIMALCYFSHTQNIILLALLPFGFISIKRWQLVIAVLLIGIAATALKDNFFEYLDSGGIEDADYINGKMKDYGEGTAVYFGNSIGEFVIFLFRYVPFAIFVLSLVKMVLTNRHKYLSYCKSYRSMINVTIGLVITSMVVMFASLSAGIFFYRILSMALFPFSILLFYMVENKTIKKSSFNMYILIYIIGTELGYIKDLYYAYAGNIS